MSTLDLWDVTPCVLETDTNVSEERNPEDEGNMLLRKNFGIKESTQRYNPEDQH
jgi:hypothetical protein